MHWQEKSVPLEKLALVPAKFEFIGGQCDTTHPLAAGALDLRMRFVRRHCSDCLGQGHREVAYRRSVCIASGVRDGAVLTVSLGRKGQMC